MCTYVNHVLFGYSYSEALFLLPRFIAELKNGFKTARDLEQVSFRENAQVLTSGIEIVPAPVVETSFDTSRQVQQKMVTI